LARGGLERSEHMMRDDRPPLLTPASSGDVDAADRLVARARVSLGFDRIEAAVYQTNLTALGRQALLAILHRARQKQDLLVRISRADLVALTLRSERAVMKAVDDLEYRGLLSRQAPAPGDVDRRTTYRLLVGGESL
jgi:hypothetical protein